MLVADLYLKNGDRETALSFLEKMVAYDTDMYEKVDADTKSVSPLLRALSHEFFHKRIDRYKNLLTKLTDKRFDALKDDARYRELLADAEAFEQGE